MKPAKLSSSLFLELPPILSHYVEADRHLWVDGNPRRGRLSVLDRAGNFVELESQAVERRHLLQLMGVERTRAHQFRAGFEQGRRDALRHMEVYKNNARLALQAALVYSQLQGRFVAETQKFEYDQQEESLERILSMRCSTEAAVQRMALPDAKGCLCWSTAGYLSGHASEILGRRVMTLETSCIGNGAETCEFVSRLDAEFGEEMNWARAAMRPESVDSELKKRDELISQAQKAARRAQGALSGMSKRVRSEEANESVATDSPAMEPVAQRAKHLMSSDAPVLISGESGTGKETLARSIHYGGNRKRNPLVQVDCTGMDDALLEQELFGYEKDAFQGATLRHTGAYVRANGGTLFLNKITELSQEMQTKLLQVIEEGMVQPKGTGEALKVDVRIIATTQEDPHQAVQSGKLREELYYALSVGRVDLPSLRERETDILRLAEDFLREFQKRYERPTVVMSAGFKKVLLDCSWPGNVRQLRNVLEHAVIMSSGGELTPDDLPEEVLATRWSRKPGELTEEVIKATLSRTHNNRTQAAQMLGVGRTTLWRSMKRYGIQ